MTARKKCSWILFRARMDQGRQRIKTEHKRSLFELKKKNSFFLFLLQFDYVNFWVLLCFGYSLFYTFTIGFNDDGDEVTCGWLELLICGDRGSGMDMLQSSYPRMKTLQENSIISFNAVFKVSRKSLFWSSKSPVVEMSKSNL